MPSRPLRRKTLVLIKERGGWMPILERIANGEGIATIAKDYVIEGHGPISRSFLSGLLHEDEARSQLAHAARKRGAEALAEQAQEIADTVPADRDYIAKARLQVDTRMRMAAAFDPGTFRESQQPQVTINVASLHLDALRRRAVEIPLPPHEIQLPRGPEPAALPPESSE